MIELQRGASYGDGDELYSSIMTANFLNSRGFFISISIVREAHRFEGV
jgi:hypothetical protein